MPERVEQMLESDAIQKDLDLIMGSIRATLCEAWLAGYHEGLSKGEAIWRPKVTDER